MSFDEQVAATRRRLALIKSLRGEEMLAASRALRDEIAADRAIPVRQLQALDAAPPRPKMQEAAAALRGIVWQAYLDAGLEGALAEWLEDIAEMEVQPKPVGRPAFTVENVSRAGVLLMEQRTAGHPFLERESPYDLDHPVWRADFVAPPGLAFEEPCGGIRHTHYSATGSIRIMEASVRHPQTIVPPGFRRWLVLEEVKAWMDAHRI